MADSTLRQTTGKVAAIIAEMTPEGIPDDFGLPILDFGFPVAVHDLTPLLALNPALYGLSASLVSCVDFWKAPFAGMTTGTRLASL